MIKLIALAFDVFHKRMKNPFTVCTSALVPEIFKVAKCVKYATEMTDDII